VRATEVDVIKFDLGLFEFIGLRYYKELKWWPLPDLNRGPADYESSEV